MPEIKFEKKKKKSFLSFSGDFTISYANELKKQLEKAVKGVDETILNVEGIETVDITCLQLFCSLHKSVKNNVKVVIKGLKESNLNKSLEQAGFSNIIGCGNIIDNCFWKGGSE